MSGNATILRLNQPRVNLPNGQLARNRHGLHHSLEPLDCA